MKSEIRIKICASNSLRLIIAVKLIAVFAVISYLFDVNKGMAVSAVIFLVLILFFYRSQLQHIFLPRSYWELALLKDFSLQLRELGRDGEFISTHLVAIEPSSKVWSFWVFLHLRAEDGWRINWCVMPDALSREDFRRLKVLSRFASQRIPSNILALDQ